VWGHRVSPRPRPAGAWGHRVSPCPHPREGLGGRSPPTKNRMFIAALCGGAAWTAEVTIVRRVQPPSQPPPAGGRSRTPAPGGGGLGRGPSPCPRSRDAGGTPALPGHGHRGVVFPIPPPAGGFGGRSPPRKICIPSVRGSRRMDGRPAATLGIRIGATYHRSPRGRTPPDCWCGPRSRPPAPRRGSGRR